MVDLRPRESAISDVTGWIWIPIHPRATDPLLFKDAITSLATSDGMAKPMPTLPPDGEKIAVLTPTT